MGLTEGMTNETINAIGLDQTAKSMGSGGYPVAATPYLVLAVENAAYTLAQGGLEEGKSTVGTRMDFEHLRATPEGMKITSKVVLSKIEGKRLVFTFEVFDDVEKVAQGEHERFIVDNERFVSKAFSKLDN